MYYWSLLAPLVSKLKLTLIQRFVLDSQKESSYRTQVIVHCTTLVAVAKVGSKCKILSWSPLQNFYKRSYPFYRCDDPFLFNPEKETCDWPSNVECGGAVPGVDCPAAGIVNVANEKSCSKYYICVNGTAFADECADGLLFDAVDLICRNATLVDCGYVKVCTGQKDGTYVPGFTCNQYFICVGEEQYERNCLAGLEYDPVEKRCVKSETCG